MVIANNSDDEIIECGTNGIQHATITFSNCSSCVQTNETVTNRLEIENGKPQDPDHGDSPHLTPSNANSRWRINGQRLIRLASRTSSNARDESRRAIIATPLAHEKGQPMGHGQRFLKNMEFGRQFLRSSFFGEESEGNSETNSSTQMYRLRASRAGNEGKLRRIISFLYAVINCGAVTHTVSDPGPNPNRWITDYFYWLFRKGWATVIAVGLIFYYFYVLLFTLLIILAADLDGDCVRAGGIPFSVLPSKFSDAFSLSWNAFSTVGYGSTYPAVSTEQNHKGDKTCAFISFITSLEALVGVIYAGFTGAIIFAKITRISQRARVTFSQPLLLKYGKGVSAEVCNYRTRSLELDEKDAEFLGKTKFQSLAKQVKQPPPFPILEFRLANELHDTCAGEIIGSQVNAVVLIETPKDAMEVGDSSAKQIQMDKTKRTAIKQKTLPLSRSFGDSTNLQRPFTSDNPGALSSHQTSDVSLNKSKHLFRVKKMKIDEEGSNCKIVPHMVFFKLTLDNSEHPFFKRLWTLRHVVDKDSPLLSQTARQRILDNNGYWPWEWNNHDAIRKAIRFNQIIVSFTGVSNISTASVYKQNVYDFADLAVGYQFVNPLYRGKNGKLKMDMNIINDVIEQNGGGGEPLNIVD